MVTKKEQERDELHRAIWAIADDLRGSVDGWDFKSYVLGFMFYRYISENLTNYINKGEHAAGNTDFDYTALSDEEAEFAREDLVNEKGFFIKPSALFCNIRKNLMMITLTKRLKRCSVILRNLRRVPTVKTILQACLMILM